MLVIEPLDQRTRTVAQEVQAIFALAHAQEAAEIGLHVDTPSRPRGVEDVMSSAEFHLGAREDGVLVGVLTVGADTEEQQVALSTLVVHPGHQRKGVGRSLVREALERGRGLDFSVIASARNGPALALYRSMGFVEYRRGNMGRDHLPMVKLRKRAP